MDLVRSRLLDLRNMLKVALGDSYEERFAGVLERLNVSPDRANYALDPPSERHERRLTHLFDVFSSTGGTCLQQVPSVPMKVPGNSNRRAAIVRRKSLLGFEDQEKSRISPDEAVTRISSIYRMIKAKRAFQASKEAELEKLGLVPPLEDPACVAEADLFMRRRKETAVRYLQEWKLMRAAAIAEYRKAASEKLEGGFSVDTRREIWEFRQREGMFPETVELLLNPPPPPLPASLKKQGSKKKSVSQTHVVEAAPTWSSAAAIGQWLASFDWDAPLCILPDKEKERIDQELKIVLILKLNQQLEVWKSQDPKNTGEPVAITNDNSQHSVDEQDIIDLIKSGILISPREEGFSDIYADVFSPSGLSALKSEIIETLVFPLSSEFVWEHIKCNRTFLFNGPRGSGKKMFLRAAARDSGAVICKISKETKPETLDLIFRVASHLAPAVVSIENLNKLIEPPRKGEKKKKSKDGELIDQIFEKFNQQGNGEKRIVLIACATGTVPEPVAGKFAQKIIFSNLNEDDRAEIIKQLLLKRGVPIKVVRANLVLIRTVARKMANLSASEIGQVIDSVRNFRMEDFELAIARHKNNKP
jgi:hypothetical protein